MKRAGIVVIVASALLGCPGSNGGQGGAGSGSGPGSNIEGPPVKSCAELKPKIEGLYRAEAQAKEPKRVEEAVADNTAMVLNDCAKSPDKVIPCVSGAASVADLESRCLSPLDEEGTEGDALRR